jgi:membrane protease YdiL (CAAX protease family)
MRVEPPYAPPYQINAPQVPPPMPEPDPRLVALERFLDRHAGACLAVITALALLAGALLLWLGWIAVSAFFSDSGLYTMTGLVVLIAAPRLCLTLLVIGGIIAVASVDQVIPRATELLTQGWPLGLAVVAVVLALVVERVFFR